MSKRGREVTSEISQSSQVKKSSRIAQQQVDIFIIYPEQVKTIWLRNLTFPNRWVKGEEKLPRKIRNPEKSKRVAELQSNRSIYF